MTVILGVISHLRPGNPFLCNEIVLEHKEHVLVVIRRKQAAQRLKGDFYRGELGNTQQKLKKNARLSDVGGYAGIALK